VEHVIIELGGWADMEMVQKYAHLSSDHLAKYVESISGELATGNEEVAMSQLRQC
jgi:hypothetical protein